MAGPTTTIVDVAKAAGVGVGTVSRVINNARFVRPSTATAVREAMERLGYEPPTPDRRRGPRGARTARRVQANADIVLLVLGPQGLRWILDCAPVFSYVLEGIESAVTQLGQNLIVRQAVDWERASEVFGQGQFHGVIILGQNEPEGLIPPALSSIPAVWVMGSPRHFAGDHVQGDHLRVGDIAAEQLLKLGHTNVAYLGASLGSMAFQVSLRGEAFRWRMIQSGGEVQMLIDPTLTLVNKGLNAPNEPVLGKLLDKMLAKNPRPTALLIQADMYAPSVYRQLLERGVRPMRDITIVTCNNERPYLVSLQPAPHIVDLQAQVIGRRAVDQLMWRATHMGEPQVRLMVQPTLIEPSTESQA